MIVVDACRPCGAPWPGGVACHLVSDESERELLDFAQGIGIPLRWYQIGALSAPHFDLSPSWRKKAIAAGAVTVNRPGMVEAIRRWRSRRSS
jgi:hypothetical protein